MHHQGGYLYYACGDFQALELCYQGRQLSMLIVLPRKKDGLAAVERQWATKGAYRQVLDGLDYQETVIVSLPCFKLEIEFKLRPVLCRLHADLAFSDEADFSDLQVPAKEVFFAQIHQPGRLCASDFTHVTSLQVMIGGVPPPT